MELSDIKNTTWNMLFIHFICNPIICDFLDKLDLLVILFAFITVPEEIKNLIHNCVFFAVK